MAPSQVEALLTRSLESSSSKDVLLMASAAGTPPCREPRSRLLAGARALLLEAPPEGHFHPGRCGGLREDTQE